MRHRTYWFRLVFVLVLFPVSLSPAADDLEKQLLAEAPQIMQSLQDKGYKNVAVLKFRVKKGDEPASDRVGSLNLRLAEKLELALIVVNKVRSPIGIVRNANAIAAAIPGANHLTQAGRQPLFSREYPLAWGDETVIPDAFLTGVAMISRDLQNMTVGIFAFDRDGESLLPLARFDVRPDLDDLIESGESFTVRGVFDQGSLSLTTQQRKDKATEEAVLTSLKVQSETAGKTEASAARLHPLAPGNPDSPIELEIQYDNQTQPIEFREGAAFVAEPQEGQQVLFIVKRKGPAQQRLGLVLKVNGENTLNRQKLPDSQAKAWVLEPDRTSWGFQGYYDPSSDTLQPFTVLSQAESQEKEIDYGEFVGTISLSVFPEQKVEPKPSTEILTAEGEDFQILVDGAFPEKKAESLRALKSQLAQDTSSTLSRGLIGAGETVKQELDATKFQRDTVPIMTATIKYYSPQDLPQ